MGVEYTYEAAEASEPFNKLFQENGEMQWEAFQDDGNVANRFIAYLGEDRGARITITNSTFKHMHFCKGMIVYRE